MLAPKVKSKPKAGKMRTVYIDELPEDMKPWVGRDFKGTKLRLKDTPYPYTRDGFISPAGWFFQVPAGGHDHWARSTFGVMSSYLARSGWVMVWSYESMFYKPGHTPTPHFRYELEGPKLTTEQKATMVRWCEGQKIGLKRALGWYYEHFMEEP